VVGAGDTFLVCDNEEKIYIIIREEESPEREREAKIFFFRKRRSALSPLCFSVCRV